MGGRGSRSSADSTAQSTTAKLQAEIDRLKQENIDLMQRDYTGRKGWDKQLQSDINKAAKNNRQIEKLERQMQNAEKQTKKPESKPKETKTAPTWRRAGEGWYVGENGHEIRENYDTGGYDVVKVSGSSVRTVKHFAKLSQARKYNP